MSRYHNRETIVFLATILFMAKNSGHHFFHLIIVFYDLGLQMEYFPRN